MPAMLFFKSFSFRPSDDFISSSASLSLDSDAWFVTIKTDPYEGSAMMTLPVARALHEELGRLLAVADAHRSKT